MHSGQSSIACLQPERMKSGQTEKHRRVLRCVRHERRGARVRDLDEVTLGRQVPLPPPSNSHPARLSASQHSPRCTPRERARRTVASHASSQPARHTNAGRIRHHGPSLATHFCRPNAGILTQAPNAAPQPTRSPARTGANDHADSLVVKHRRHRSDPLRRSAAGVAPLQLRNMASQQCRVAVDVVDGKTGRAKDRPPRRP